MAEKDHAGPRGDTQDRRIITVKHLNPDERTLEDIRLKLDEVISVINMLEGQGRAVRVVSLNNAFNFQQGFISAQELEQASWLTSL